MKKTAVMIAATFLMTVVLMCGCGKQRQANVEEIPSSPTPDTGATDVILDSETAETEPEEELPVEVEEPEEPVTDTLPAEVEAADTEDESNAEPVRGIEITVPAEYAEPSYSIGELSRNEDGSVTYLLTEEEHEALLKDVHSAIQAELDEMSARPAFLHVDSITANEDCSVFTVVVVDINLSRAEQASIPRLYELGRMFAAYLGEDPDGIRIDYMTQIGNTFTWRNSSWDHWTGELNY